MCMHNVYLATTDYTYITRYTYYAGDASHTKNLTLLMKEGHCMGPADL